MTQSNLFCDTGAQQSCMPFKAFKRIHNPAKLRKLTLKELHIRDEGGNDLEYKGTYLVQTQLLGRKVMHDLVVLEHVQDNINGINLIHQHTLIYNSLTNKCFGKLPLLTLNS
jgi:hypothetical protein